MTGWDVLNTIIKDFPPVAMILLLLVAITAAVVFVVGFTRHGVNFIKYGLKQSHPDDLSVKIDELRADVKRDFGELRADVKSDIDELRGELNTIKVNHFGHLKKYLGVLNGILLDKNIIDNESKARLDNELDGM